MIFKLFSENVGVHKDKWHPKVQFLSDDILYRERGIIKKWTEGLIDRDNRVYKKFRVN